MATIRLEVSDAGIRPSGFYSRDRADEAVVELKALLGALAADRKPVAVRWADDDGLLVPVRTPLWRSDAPTEFGWDPDSGALSGTVAGLPLNAIAEAHGFRVVWAGHVLSRRSAAWVDGKGDRIGPDLPDRVEAAPLVRIRGGRAVLGRLRLHGDVPLPSGARAVGRLYGRDAELLLGDAKIDGDGRASWGLPPRERWPTAPWELEFSVNIAAEGAQLRLPVIEETAFSNASARAEGRIVDQVRPGDAITAVHFDCGGQDAAPPRVVLGFASPAGDHAVEAIGHDPVRDLTGVTYRLEPPLGIPLDLLVPGRLRVIAEGQDDDAGLLVVAPRHVRARFRLVRDERGSARTPRVDAAFLEPVGMRPGRFQPAEDGSVAVEIDGVSCTAPLLDDAFVPILRTDPKEPIWKARTNAERGTVTAWAPGYPPVDVPVDAEGRLRPRSPAFEEMAREWSRRGLPMRLEQGERRGVVWPADGHAEGTEVEPTGGAFFVQSGSTDTLAFRGFLLRVHLREAGDHSALVLDRPLPVDGRLGLDVAAFLPVRAQRLADSVRVRVGFREVRLTDHAGRWRAEREDPALRYESRWGFHAEWPRDGSGRLALDGVIFAVDRAGIAFHGWVLDPAFKAKASDPWTAYAFRAGAASTGPVCVGREGPAPGVPAQALDVARHMIATSARAPVAVRCDDGDYDLVPVFDNPRQPPVHVEVHVKTSRAELAVRLFRR